MRRSLASPRALSLALACVLPLLPHAAAAQQVIGTVMLPDGQTPAPGVIVVARDSAGRDVAQAVSAAEGRFALFVDANTALRLHLLREGHAPTPGPVARVGTDEIADVVATLADAPVRLPSWPRGASSCGRGSVEERATVALLLEEARKSFVLAQATIGRDDLTARYATFDHRLAKLGEDTLRTLVRRAQGTVPSLFRATTTDELEAAGFFVTVGGERVFRALEPGLLATPWFIDTHCFTAAAPTDTVLRLAFTPRRERKGLVDIEGAYRFHARTLELLGVEARYVGLRDEERKSGAHYEFWLARLASGERVVAAWRQRVPLLGYRQGDGTTTFVRSSMTLVDITGHRTTGGQLSAVLREGAPLLLVAPLGPPLATTEFGRACPERLDTRATGAATGTLVARDTTESVAGRVVRVRWGQPVVIERTKFSEREQLRETVTDAQGRWVVCDLPPRVDLTFRYERRGGEEVVVPFTLPAAGTIVTVPPAP